MKPDWTRGIQHSTGHFDESLSPGMRRSSSEHYLAMVMLGTPTRGMSVTVI
jgi:hypothetical protein